MGSMQGPDWEDAGRPEGLYLGLAGYRAGSEAGSRVGRCGPRSSSQSWAGQVEELKVGGGELGADEGRGHSCREPQWR